MKAKEEAIQIHEDLLRATESTVWLDVVRFLEWRERQAIEQMLRGPSTADDQWKGAISEIRALKHAKTAAPKAIKAWRSEDRKDEDDAGTENVQQDAQDA